MFKLPTDKRWFWVSCSIAVFLSLGCFIWKVPQMGIPASITDEKVKAELLNANRDNALKVIQTVAGLGFIGTAYLAWRNLQLTEDKNVTDRFSKAVEMLADSEKLEVRLGGIYSLERIARDSKADHSVVMEVLTAFVRARSPRTEETEENQEPISQDIQSALTVIGRRTPTENEQTIDLSAANLIRANLSGAILKDANLKWADLKGANLIGANLIGAKLSGAKLKYANLSEAILSGVKLAGADLAGADLIGADLKGTILIQANLSEADLSRADLSRADLSRAILSRAILKGANLKGANLKGADLIAANLKGARWDDKTQWPDPTEVTKALDIPEALKQQLGLPDVPPQPDSDP